jgi:hypothetical protein
MRIPVTPNLHIEKFAAGSIIEASSYGKNVVFEQYTDGRWYVTQRPGINLFEDCSDTVADVQGRGIYYWDAASKKIISNYDTLYEDSYGGTSNSSMTAGHERVYMFEIGVKLAIIDPENNEGWTIGTGGVSTIAAISDGDFPSALADGGAVLNGKLYLMDTAGDIYESDIEDATAWGALNFRNAEAEPDGGVYLAKHHENIVAFGTRSIEFFHDAGNPTGSTLSPRLDISYDVGAVDGHHVWEENDIIFFVGQSRSGGIGVYVIDNFQLRNIGNNSIDSMVASAILDDDMKVMGAGFQTGGKAFYMLTIYNLTGGSSDTISSESTLCYSTTLGVWGIWETALGINDFPVVAWTPSDTTRNGEGILANGDLVTVIDDFNPHDTTAASSVYEAGVFETGIYTATEATGANIPIELVLGHTDNGTRRLKFMSELWAVSVPTNETQTLTVSVADDQNSTFTQIGTIDTSDAASRINRLGSYRQRNFKLNFESDEQFEFEALEARVSS